MKRALDSLGDAGSHGDSRKQVSLVTGGVLPAVIVTVLPEVSSLTVCSFHTYLTCLRREEPLCGEASKRLARRRVEPCEGTDVAAGRLMEAPGVCGGGGVEKTQGRLGHKSSHLFHGF